MHSTKLIIAAIIALGYVVLAGALVREDRKTSTGGFINLQGMLSGLLTLPVAFPLEYAGHKLDYRSNWQMGLAIIFCAGLIFGICLGVMSFFSSTGTLPTPKP